MLLNLRKDIGDMSFNMLTYFHSSKLKERQNPQLIKVIIRPLRNFISILGLSDLLFSFGIFQSNSGLRLLDNFGYFLSIFLLSLRYLDTI